MNPQEKAAWYTLAVVLLAVSVFLVLYSLTGHLFSSMSAMAVLALLAFGGLFGVGKKDKVLGDEHDADIARRARSVVAIVFWLYYVAGGVLLPMLHHQNIPTDRFFAWFMLGVLVVIVVQAVATLILYRVDTTERVTFVDWLGGQSVMRKQGLVIFGIMLFVMTPFTFAMAAVGRGETPPGFGYRVCGSFAVSYVLFLVSLGRYTRSGQDLRVLAKARKLSFLVLGITLLGVVAGKAVVAALPIQIELLSKIPQAVFYVLMAGIFSLAMGLIIFGGTKAESDSTAAKEQPDA